MTRSKQCQSVERVVVKVGTSTLTHPTGEMNLFRLESLVRELADLKNRGLEVILVTSGAVGAGIGKVGGKKPSTMPEKQAMAAIGQGALLHMYEKFFAEYGKTVGQILLTKEDLADRGRHLNARNTLFALLQYGAIPIINENDTVTVDEIKFGDNDTLAALVATLIDADLLILLSDIEGLYTDNPKKNPEATLIKEVNEIDEDIFSLADGTGSEFASGGMQTKINAAKIATLAGIPMVIANGENTGVIKRILDGEECGTFFRSSNLKVKNRKCWLAWSAKAKGSIFVDEGAFHAIAKSGKSLLSIGITDISGRFDVGSVVSLKNHLGNEFAKGIVNYSSDDLEKIRGKRTYEIKNILGDKDYDAVVHRDNLSLN